MSPFSNHFQHLRKRHGISQRALAELMGFEQGFISTMELGRKGPPNESFINKLVIVFGLNNDEETLLRKTVKNSHRKFVLPTDASTELYEFLHELWDQLDNLDPIQVNLMRQIVGIKNQLNVSSKLVEIRRYGGDKM